MLIVIVVMLLINEELFKIDELLLFCYLVLEVEYWLFVQEVEYWVDYYCGEIIVFMSYEFEDYVEIMNELMFYLKFIYCGLNVCFGNSNCLVCILICGNVIFNLDGFVIQLLACFYEY